jgi:hypothetical protein
MAGENGALWQVATSAANGTEATASGADVNNVALFNDTAKIIGTTGVSYISDIVVDFRKAVPENESVNTDNNEIQDMGIMGFDVIIKGVTGDTDNDVATNLVNKLSGWLQEDNATTGYTKGRFGLRLDNAPQWNVVPTSTYGMHLLSANFQYIGEDQDKCAFTIKLALGGDLNSAI